HVGKFAYLALSVLKRRHAGGDHCALGRAKVTAREILRDHEGDCGCIVALELDIARLHVSGPTRAVAVAAIEDHALVECDRVEQAVLGDVADHALKLRAFDQRENVGERMEPHDSPPSRLIMSSAAPSGPLALPFESRQSARRIASGSAPC